MTLDDIDPKSLAIIGQMVQKKRKALGWTQLKLASESGHNEKDIRKLERGALTKFVTISNICQTLSISPEQHLLRTADINVADDKYGSYNRSHYANHIGLYFAYRRSLTVPENFLRTIFDITWSSDRHCLSFFETHNYATTNGKSVDFSQGGDIYINNNMGLFHLMTCSEGAVRLITLSKLRTHSSILGGVVLTQLRNTLYYSPAVSPIYLEKIVETPDRAAMLSMIGPISPTHNIYTTVATHINEIEQEVVYFPPATDALYDSKITRMVPRISSR